MLIDLITRLASFESCEQRVCKIFPSDPQQFLQDMYVASQNFQVGHLCAFEVNEAASAKITLILRGWHRPCAIPARTATTVPAAPPPANCAPSNRGRRSSRKNGNGGKDDRKREKQLHRRSIRIPNEFFIDPVAAVMPPPDFSNDDPAGDGSSRNDDHVEVPNLRPRRFRTQVHHLKVILTIPCHCIAASLPSARQSGSTLIQPAAQVHELVGAAAAAQEIARQGLSATQSDSASEISIRAASLTMPFLDHFYFAHETKPPSGV